MGALSGYEKRNLPDISPLFQTDVMFHHPFEQRHPRAHKAVLYFKTGKFIQSDA